MDTAQPETEAEIMIRNWREQARAHWQEFRPTLYRGLKRSGKLEQALTDAAERTELEMKQLQGMGFYTHEAWEIVRESYLFSPEEGKPWAYGDASFWTPPKD